MLECVRVGGSRLAVALACVALFATASLSPRFIPYCMDEFAHYHALGCATHPLTRQWTAHREGSVFREGCGRYDLRLPFTDTPLPLRAYHYIGSLPALPFLPFWALGDPVAVRVQGAFFLLVSSALLARLTGARFLDLLLAACVFPAYALAFLVDLGPVGLSLVLLCLALLSVRAALRAETRRRELLFAAAAGLAFFLGLWTKLVFAWTLPALLLFAWSESRRAPAASTRRSLWPAVTASLAAALPSLLLLAAADADGARYVSIVREGNLSLSAFAGDLGLQPFLRLIRYVTDGCFALPRIVMLHHLPLDVAPLLLAASSLALAFGAATVRRLLAMALVTGLVTLSTRSAGAPHHAAFAFFFVVAALGIAVEALRRRDRRLPVALAAAVSLYWLTLAARLPAAEIQADAGFGKDTLLRIVRREGLDRRTVVAHTSWGTYYIGLLFGDREQINLWAPALPAKPAAIAEVQKIAAAEGRGVALISLRREPDILTPAVLAALHAPVAERQFDGWSLVEFGR